MPHKDPLKRAEYQKKYRLLNKGKLRKLFQKYTKNGYWKIWDKEHKVSRRITANKKDKIKVRARRAVLYAVKVKKLARGRCRDCSRVKTEAHHEDYSKPLEVTWLCRRHHNKQHEKNKNIV